MNMINMEKNFRGMTFCENCGVIKSDTFSLIYPYLNSYIVENKNFQDSRDGKVKELLDFKTIITNPYRRCVGGCERDINIFFLLAEAMWIATGRKDVKFLTLFNKRMINFSDNGVNFHAPYGHRLRHWNVRSEDSFVEGMNADKGYDQVIDAIKIFTENENSRQVVLSIWNPEFDLGTKTKDIPCNDLIMLKIRDGKLITTIQNRSNDLHWGLPTNLFQFSFLTELIASSLGIELGTQTHNSQSLHIYEWNDIAEKMNNLYLKKINDDDSNIILDMYSGVGAKEKHMDFNFSHDIPVNRFREIDYYLNMILDNLTKISEGEIVNEEEIKDLNNFSKYLFNCYKLLELYLNYKASIICMEKEDIKEERMKAVSKIDNLIKKYGEGFENWDIWHLSKNFFLSKLLKEETNTFIGKL